AWHLIHIWRSIDMVFDTMPDAEAVRGEEASSIASFRQKCDIIMMCCIGSSHSGATAYGAGEAATII
ncbi:hypothetical protein BJV82DRAFT_516716, partial [Fennellomyces sp. T-0311]